MLTNNKLTLQDVNFIAIRFLRNYCPSRPQMFLWTVATNLLTNYFTIIIENRRWICRIVTESYGSVSPFLEIDKVSLCKWSLICCQMFYGPALLVRIEITVDIVYGIVWSFKLLYWYSEESPFRKYLPTRHCKRNNMSIFLKYLKKKIRKSSSTFR